MTVKTEIRKFVKEMLPIKPTLAMLSQWKSNRNSFSLSSINTRLSVHALDFQPFNVSEQIF